MNKMVVFCAILILFLAETSSLSPDFQPVQSTAQVNANPSLNSLTSYYDNVTTHEGNLIIDGTQTFVIENCSYTQIGNIQVKDYGTFIIRNSYFLFNQTSDYQYPGFSFDIRNNAKIIMEDTDLVNNQTYQMHVFDHAFLTAKNLTTESLGTSHNLGIFAYNNADITINESKMSYYVSFQDFSNVHIFNSTFAELDCGNGNWFGPQRPSVEIMNAKISSCYVYPNSSTSIFNSSVGSLVFAIRKSAIEIDGLEPGFFSSWNSYENCSVLYGIPNITLSATSIGDWELSIFEDSRVYVTRSVLTLLPCPNCTASAQDSVISLNTWTWTPPHTTYYYIEMESCNVTGLWLHDYEGCLLFSNTRSNEYFAMVNSHFYMVGNITFENQPWVSQYWTNASITRNYDAIARDNIGRPISNASLLLKSNNQSLVWNGTTDDFGRADFNITFTDNNYTDTLRLEAVNGNLSGAQNVTFLSDTPVIVELPLHDDAITDAVPLKTVVGQGFPLHVKVTSVNRGNFTETFNVTVYSNYTKVETQLVTLKNGTSTTVTFVWNTTSLAYGNYTISAVADTVPNEADVTDNNCTFNGSVLITIPGDIDGNFRVQLQDLVFLAKAYGSKLGDPNWNPNADIDGNGAVGLSDLVILAQRYGQHYP